MFCMVKGKDGGAQLRIKRKRLKMRMMIRRGKTWRKGKDERNYINSMYT